MNIQRFVKIAILSVMMSCGSSSSKQGPAEDPFAKVARDYENEQKQSQENDVIVPPGDAANAAAFNALVAASCNNSSRLRIDIEDSDETYSSSLSIVVDQHCAALVAATNNLVYPKEPADTVDDGGQRIGAACSESGQIRITYRNAATTRQTSAYIRPVVCSDLTNIINNLKL